MPAAPCPGSQQQHQMPHPAQTAARPGSAAGSSTGKRRLCKQPAGAQAARCKVSVVRHMTHTHAHAHARAGIGCVSALWLLLQLLCWVRALPATTLSGAKPGSCSQGIVGLHSKSTFPETKFAFLLQAGCCRCRSPVSCPGQPAPAETPEPEGRGP